MGSPWLLPSSCEDNSIPWRKVLVRRSNQRLAQSNPQIVGIPDLAFPDRYHFPTSIDQFALRSRVPRDVRFEFLRPKSASRLRRRCSTAPFVSMPETSMNEHHRPVLGQNDVRSPRQTRNMESESVPHRVQQAAYDHFRLCILAPHGTHVGAAGGIYAVGFLAFDGGH